MILKKPFLFYHVTLLDTATPPLEHSSDNILDILDILGLKITLCSIVIR